MSKKPLIPKPLPKGKPVVRRGLGARPIDLSQAYCACRCGLGCSCNNEVSMSCSNPTTSRSSSSWNSNARRSHGMEKCLGVPKANSSKSQEKLIQEAILDISNIPKKIEDAVSRKIIEPKFQKLFMQKASTILNVPQKGKIYHDLLDIETVPPIHVKRPPTAPLKPVDPVPVITDYNTAEYIRIPPLPAFRRPEHSRRRRPTNTIDLNANFDPNDLLQYERRFSSNRPY